MKLEIPILLLIGFSPKQVSNLTKQPVTSIYHYNQVIKEMKERIEKVNI